MNRRKRNWADIFGRLFFVVLAILFFVLSGARFQTHLMIEDPTYAHIALVESLFVMVLGIAILIFVWLHGRRKPGYDNEGRLR